MPTATVPRYQPTTCANGADPESACGARGEALYALPGFTVCGSCLTAAAEEGGAALTAELAAGDVREPGRYEDWHPAALAVRFPGSHAPPGDHATYHLEAAEAACHGVLLLDSAGDPLDPNQLDPEGLADALGAFSSLEADYQGRTSEHVDAMDAWIVSLYLPDGTELGPFPFRQGTGYRGDPPEPGRVLASVLSDLSLATSAEWTPDGLAAEIDMEPGEAAELAEQLRAIYQAAAPAGRLLEALYIDAPPERPVPAYLAEPLADLRAALGALPEAASGPYGRLLASARRLASLYRSEEE